MRNVGKVKQGDVITWMSNSSAGTTIVEEDGPGYVPSTTFYATVNGETRINLIPTNLQDESCERCSCGTHSKGATK